MSEVKIHIVQGEITAVSADVIVIAALQSLMPKDGINSNIFSKAGKELAKACNDFTELRLGIRCEVGDVVRTDAFDLSAQYIVHAVCPTWYGGKSNEEARLDDCYKAALELCVESDAECVAFFPLSTGAFGYPFQLSVLRALTVVNHFLLKNESIKKLMFVCQTEEDVERFKEQLPAFQVPLIKENIPIQHQEEQLSLTERWVAPENQSPGVIERTVVENRLIRHYRSLEAMYSRAPINEYFQPTLHVGEGRATITVTVKREYTHTAGAIHGCVYFKMLDDAAFFAANSVEPEFFLLTTDFHIRLMKPVIEGVLTAKGTLSTVGRRNLYAEAKMYDESGDVVAMGHGAFFRSKVRLSKDNGYHLDLGANP